ncbi:MAG TPA: riboflavin biosynthesis protein RibF [Flavisolibacter sp.]|jgi:riboflavin kinase/FMN adenylyltransferase|nr:riboflavin biosynthesis protein RibF [Flavisolibacter sp.]
MKVHHDIEKLPAFKNAVITIGTFDGVHAGHQKIIAALKAEAATVVGETVIITFNPHPRKIVKAIDPLQLINTLEEKIDLLTKAGIDHLVVVPFTPAFSELTADEYIVNFLIGKFHPVSIIIGYDHHFGKGRSGNYTLLEEQAAEFNYNLVEIPKHLLDEVGVSSTKIRNAILSGDITAANKLLGYSFFFDGRVVKGDQLGRTLGYPTANLELIHDDKIRLGHGVYAVYASINGERRKGMLSIGNRPTLVASEEKIEVNIFDFNKTIYGETVHITVEHFLRPQEKYPSLDVMVQQLHKDKEKSLELLSGIS